MKKNGENDRKPAEISETESPPEVGLILPEDQGILALEFVDIGNNIFRSVKLYDRKSFSENLELINDIKVNFVRMGQIADELNPAIKEFMADVPWVLFEIIDVVEIMDLETLLNLVDSLPKWVGKVEHSVFAN